jgi:hypothetical protein
MMGQEALTVAISVGSVRTENEVRQLADGLKPHQDNQNVQHFLAELATTP